MDKIENFYEIRDVSNDEMYYSIGMFTTLEDAKSELDGMCLPDNSVSEYAEDYEKIEIIKRKVGWDYHPWNTVHTVEREKCLSDNDEEYVWREVKHSS